MILIFIYAIVLYIGYRLYEHFFPPPNIYPNGKYVLISGCDSGFGHGLAIELDKQGFNVLAGVLLQDNVDSLKIKLSPKATVFRLDITKQDDIDAAFQLVKDKTNTLHALVNNAGIGDSGYIDWITMENMRKTMDVNFFGHVAMTKKFLSLLIAKRDSRVVNIASVAGFLSGPRGSAYSASKYAVESFSDCLRREMFPWNLRVSIIEPGPMRTPIILGRRKPFEDFISSLPPDVVERWGESYLKQQYDTSSTDVFFKNAEDPMKVVRALQHAVMSTVPHIRYRPGIQSKFIFHPLSMLPAWIIDWLYAKSNKSSVLPASVYKQIKD